jgi:hypothetical protein
MFYIIPSVKDSKTVSGIVQFEDDQRGRNLYWILNKISDTQNTDVLMVIKRQNAILLSAQRHMIHLIHVRGKQYIHMQTLHEMNVLKVRTFISQHELEKHNFGKDCQKKTL